MGCRRDRPSVNRLCGCDRLGSRGSWKERARISVEPSRLSRDHTATKGMIAPCIDEAKSGDAIEPGVSNTIDMASRPSFSTDERIWLIWEDFSPTQRCLHSEHNRAWHRLVPVRKPGLGEQNLWVWKCSLIRIRGLYDCWNRALWNMRSVEHSGKHRDLRTTRLFFWWIPRVLFVRWHTGRVFRFPHWFPIVFEWSH